MSMHKGCAMYRYWLAMPVLLLVVQASAQDGADAILGEILDAYRFRAENLDTLILEFQGEDMQGLALDEAGGPRTGIGGLVQDGVITWSSEFGLRLDRNQDILNETTLEAYSGIITNIVRRDDLGETWAFTTDSGLGYISTGDTLSSYPDVQYLLFTFRDDAPFLAGAIPWSGMEDMRVEGSGMPMFTDAQREEFDRLAELYGQRDVDYVGLVETEEGVRAVLRTRPPVIEGHEIDPAGFVKVPFGEGGFCAPFKETDYWLDPERHYVMTRMTARSLNGKVAEEVRLEYQPDPNIGFVPSAFEFTAYDHQGDMVARHRRTVVAAVTNGPLDETVFGKPFPKGTVVKDHIRGLEYVAGDEPSEGGGAAGSEVTGEPEDPEVFNPAVADPPRIVSPATPAHVPVLPAPAPRSAPSPVLLAALLAAVAVLLVLAIVLRLSRRAAPRR